MQGPRFGLAVLLGLTVAAGLPGTAQASAVSVKIRVHPADLTAKTRATFTLTASRGATLYCRLDSRPRQRCHTSIVYNNLTNGAHVFVVQATYRGGSDTASDRFTVDTVAPSRPTGSGGSVHWEDHPITICGSGAKDLHGVSSYQYREMIGKGNWGIAHPGRCVTVTQTAATRLQFRAIDLVGNVGAWSDVGPGSIARVDRAAPESPQFVTESVIEGCAIEGPVLIGVKTRDAGSGVSHYMRQVRVDDRPFSTPFGFLPGVPIINALFGTRSYRVWAVDRAGNQSFPSFVTVCIEPPPFPPDVPPDTPPDFL
jgi:hypothetical protein